MELCSFGHDEVCYDGGKCPLCDMVKEKEQAVDELKYELDIAKDKISDLEGKIAILEESA